MNLQDYFYVTFNIVKGIPQISLKLKEELKITKEVPIKAVRGNIKIPMSGSQVEYFIHYLGENLGPIVYNQRKKLFPKTKLIDWYISNFDISNDNLNLLIQYKQSISDKIKKSLIEHYTSDKGEATREKLRIRTQKWKHIIGAQNSEKWKDKEYSKKRIQQRHDSGAYKSATKKNRQRMSDPVYKEKFLKAVRNPDRIQKISKATKKMWKNAKINDIEKTKRMLYSGRNKQYDFKGIKMNSIEYLVAQVLDDMNLKFEYETVVTFGTSTYVPDFYLKEHNTVIEVYGDYWHANPEIFDSTKTVFRTPVLEIWKRDKRKQEIFLENGIQYIILWEDKINNNITEIKELLCKNIFTKN